MWGEDSEAGQYSKKLLLRKQNNVKRLQWGKVHKGWTIEQCNEVLWADESKFEIVGCVYMRMYVAKSWWKRSNALYHTICKAWRRLCYGVGGLLPIANLWWKECQEYVKQG